MLIINLFNLNNNFIFENYFTPLDKDYYDILDSKEKSKIQIPTTIQ